MLATGPSSDEELKSHIVVLTINILPVLCTDRSVIYRSLKTTCTIPMLTDDEVLLDDLAEEDERALQVAERVGLTDIDPNVGSDPVDVATYLAQVFCSLVVVVLIECACRLSQSARFRNPNGLSRRRKQPQTKLLGRSDLHRRRGRVSAGSSSGSCSKAGSSGSALAASMPGCWRRVGARWIRCRTQRFLICQRYAADVLCLLTFQVCRSDNGVFARSNSLSWPTRRIRKR